MVKIKIGDKVRILRNGKRDEKIRTVMDILENYDGFSYWLKNLNGSFSLKAETPQTVFEVIKQ